MIQNNDFDICDICNNISNAFSGISHDTKYDAVSQAYLRAYPRTGLLMNHGQFINFADEISEAISNKSVMERYFNSHLSLDYNNSQILQELIIKEEWLCLALFFIFVAFDNNYCYSYGDFDRWVWLL